MAKEAPKKRGRPRKVDQAVDLAAKSSATAAPRRRGRPRKTINDAAAETVAPRPRGRPRKSPSNPSKSANVSSKSTPKARIGKETPSTTPSSAPRGKRPTNSVSPCTAVGGYEVTCKALSEEWPDMGNDFTLDVHTSTTPGVFEASFDFGILEGVIIMSADENALKLHLQKLEGDDPPISAKKKPESSPATSSLLYYLQWRGSTISDDQTTYTGPNYGKVKFTNKYFRKFRGTLDLPFLGDGVEFTGERVTDEPDGDASDWNDYDKAYGSAGPSSYSSYKNSNNWGYDRWGKWGFIG